MFLIQLGALQAPSYPTKNLGLISSCLHVVLQVGNVPAPPLLRAHCQPRSPHHHLQAPYVTQASLRATQNLSQICLLGPLCVCSGLCRFFPKVDPIPTCLVKNPGRLTTHACYPHPSSQPLLQGPLRGTFGRFQPSGGFPVLLLPQHRIYPSFSQSLTSPHGGPRNE